MEKVPTINQYLLNLVSGVQITAAEKSKDAKKIAIANRDYKDLKESEVTFGPFVRDDATGKWSTSIRANTRGWTLRKQVFSTGTIKGLARANQQGGEKLDALTLLRTPNLVYIQENDSYYLVVEKDTNVFEALKLTGYEFPADSFVPTIYGKPNKDNWAVGHVDLEHPIVAGRFLLYYLQSDSKPAGNGKDTNDQTKTDLKLQGGTNVTSDNSQEQARANSNEGDQANPSSTQTSLKGPVEPGRSEGTDKGNGQANSTDAVKDPAVTAEENLEEAKENEANFKDQQEQNKVK